MKQSVFQNVSSVGVFKEQFQPLFGELKKTICNSSYGKSRITSRITGIWKLLSSHSTNVRLRFLSMTPDQHVLYTRQLQFV